MKRPNKAKKQYAGGGDRAGYIKVGSGLNKKQAKDLYKSPGQKTKQKRTKKGINVYHSAF